MTETTPCAVCGRPLGPGIHTGVSGSATFHTGCADRWKDAELARLRAEVHALQEHVERVEEERNELARRYTHG